MPKTPEPANDVQDVLRAFIDACPRPNVQDIIDWVKRYPEHADEIRETAEIALEIAQNTDETREPSPELTARTRQITQARLQEAFARMASQSAAGPTLPDLVARAGTSVPRLSRELDIGRAVLTDLVQGRMVAPLPRRFGRALADALSTTVEAIAAAARNAAAHPQMGHARSNSAPAARQRPFAEIVAEDPTITEARKRFWLAED